MATKDYLNRASSLQGAHVSGSHMPLDIVAHWSWRNPLNVLPGSLALVIVAAVAKLVAG